MQSGHCYCNLGSLPLKLKCMCICMYVCMYVVVVQRWNTLMFQNGKATSLMVLYQGELKSLPALLPIDDCAFPFTDKITTAVCKHMQPLLPLVCSTMPWHCPGTMQHVFTIIRSFPGKRLNEQLSLVPRNCHHGVFCF